GEIVEEGNTQEVLKTPQHAYTQELLSSLVNEPNRRS
ncbi:MAG: ABC transporter ATP-binding protein, partial [Elusimicrobia bacterium]|nr:ABC transporter ATP-binding protein [Elusimicrobiota bacterium]